ncbi:uncharacterized protein PGTG_21907 [Puccinia graminis f. sp. tritici CRL 75-36-700-3]|uniref:Tyr recombinase domain-containing protein n=1 Tax=Puccinia graminis f. sp. tritici (strain CRL 75-36-700-3 / race SCCL) TaxID=418459 RepID=E3KUV1_PUCGT|nr:uncharacterized protein PGTG_12608 [Puccinia graminis f. sp. tritici CRL 75-36-700-3]XP_003889237.1 uncharacterized protein PGTG_21907 [Puccinia graminis f. sp. tritici CRL 75-36-700-3]EFP88161.1 hypothetical protein PGTG_12608 [Puccinia graminis f. sp. tritici CRL 75-36-700-3]EHS64157.1 hypothetical protein PGTG_21907 [Puccinia graminis f. sp. tritici CRL 75-36-700-3]
MSLKSRFCCGFVTSHRDIVFHISPRVAQMLSNRPSDIIFHKINFFLRDGTEIKQPTRTNIHILSAWKSSTLTSYNSAVTKFIQFQKSGGIISFRLPITGKTLEEFCIWAGRNAVTSNAGKISASSLRKYIAGLKAWHVYHDVAFPTVNKTRIDLILKASSREDETLTKQPAKSPIMFWHMSYLWVNLVHGDDFDKALLDLAIVAFWGLARLAELTYATGGGVLDFVSSVLTTDVTLGADAVFGETATLTLRNTKTGQPGRPQLVTLAEQKHVLCPVTAIRRRLSSAEGSRTSLFGYGSGERRRHLTRTQSVARLESVLASGGFTGLKGHSFRVGGASFRAAFGMSHADICLLGRWKSDCYKLYLREYSSGDLSKTKALVKQFKRSWTRMES